MFAGIAVENLIYSVDKPFSYEIPEEFESKVFVSQRVLVPFGNSKKPKIGIIVYLTDEKPDVGRIKKISALIDEEPILSEEMMSLAGWMSERYFSTLFDCCKAMLPCGVNYKLVSRYGVRDKNADISSLNDTQTEIFNFLLGTENYVSKQSICSSLGLSEDIKDIDLLVKKGFLIRVFDAKRNVGDLSEKMVRLTDNYEEVMRLSKLTVKQKNVVELLSDVQSASMKEICALFGITSAVCKALGNKGICEIYDRPVMRNPVDYDGRCYEKTELSDAQQNVYEGLKEYCNSCRDGGGAALLYGVTGSGKTSVYLKLIEDVVDSGRSVIVMVPEISLTPQTVDIFKRKFGSKIAVFHSALSMGERADEFKRVKDGDAVIAIGTRSAVFAPFENLGLIIMDEEQEHTYKSESNPRYHAREVAKFRSSYNGAMLLMASATPSVESYARAKSGKYKLFTLEERYGNASLPEVICVDLNEEQNASERVFLSKKLLEELRYNLEKKQQSIVLLNRRGYNTFVVCKKCSNVVTCPYCSISMTYHSVNNKLMCHYCGYTSNMAEKCSVCGSENIRYSGVGTQRIESEMQKLLPDARILRIDADTTTARRAFEEKFERFSKGEFDIMIGTQMVAKGLDFPNVTLVGVISADRNLYDDDYRATERSFALLTQVIGRSGRGEKKGRAVIQTYSPDNETITFAKDQDYDSFFNYEINLRKMMIYPPFCDLCTVCFVGGEETKTKAAAYAFFTILKKALDDQNGRIKVIALGPAPLKILKVGNKYRYRLILKCKNTKEFRTIISNLLIELHNNKLFSDVSAFADINPENLL